MHAGCSPSSILGLIHAHTRGGTYDSCNECSEVEDRRAMGS
jgi:hypothetical protein